MNQQTAVSLRRNFTNLTLDVIHTVIFHSAAVELVKVLTGGTNVDVEYSYVNIRILIADEHCVLCGIHTADLGAVGLTAIVGATAADTLNEYDLLGSLTVGKSLEMTVGRTCGVHNSLELEGGDNVGALVVCVLVVLIKIDGVETGCNDDCAVLFGYDLILLSIINCACCTDLLAETALTGLELDTSLGVDYGYVRDSLSEGSVDSGSGAEASVELAGSLLGGALFLTNATACTFIVINLCKIIHNCNCFFRAIKLTFFASYAGYFVQAIINNFIPLLFLTFQDSFNLSYDKISLLIVINFGVQLCVDFLSAYFIDKIGYRVSVIAAHVFACIGLGGLSIFPFIMNPYAGIILSIGVGVDCNVIAAERIREEFKKGKTVDGSIDSGFKNSLSAVIDGNVTIVIVSLVLMGAFGTPDNILAKLMSPLMSLFGTSITGSIYSFGYTLLVGTIFNLIMGVLASKFMLKSISRLKLFRNPWFYGGKKNA